MRTENLTLTNFNGRKYQVHTYLLADNPNLIENPKPMIIVIQGGSFNHLAPREGEPVALSYNSHGYHCAVMEYNLVQDTGKIYPDAGLDVLTTVKYFRDHAQELNIDPNKIVTLGFSAGGHVASTGNTMANLKKYAEKYHFEPAEVRPNATILGYPLIDIEQLGFEVPADQKDNLPAEPELKNSALGVTRETPATFIFQAWDDPIVLISNSLEYLQALNKNHVSCEAHLFNKGAHGFSLARPEVVEKDKPWIDNPHAAHWFNLSLEWLDSVLK